MKSVGIYYSLALILTVFAFTLNAQTALAPQDKPVVDQFNAQVNEYIKVRERIDNALPKLPKKATAEQIEAHKTALLKGVQATRVATKQGYIFTPQASALMRRIINAEFKGRDRRELRKTVFEAESKGIPVKVNFGYPESKEFLEMPPRLLLALPQLPKQLRYRFVGTYLLLVDRENNLIIDYMGNALP